MNIASLRSVLIVLCMVGVWAPLASRTAAQPPKNSAKPPAPPNPFQILANGRAENNYLSPILELRRRGSEFLALPPMREMYYELLVQAYLFVGDYAAAAAVEEELYGSVPYRMKARSQNAKGVDGDTLAGYSSMSALRAIGDAGDTRRIIIVNEEHRAPVHRALTYRLLPVLHAKGFRYFAAETLMIDDADIGRRGYPTQKSGFYTGDPLYADLVRRAIDLGFKIVHYEHETPCAKDDPDVCQDERELGQARNIHERILKHDPDAKILMHVGRTPAAKTYHEGHYGFMAWHLRKITGIEPFTVDQVFHTEAKNPLDETPIYNYAARKGLLFGEPTVFRSRDGGFLTRAGYDLEVFTPRATYSNGRPTWLRLGGLRRPHRIDVKRANLTLVGGKLGGDLPVLVQAFRDMEGPDAVPIDQVVLYPSREIAALMLPRGRFRVIVVNHLGKVLGQYNFRRN